jgi:hypothetical protein
MQANPVEYFSKNFMLRPGFVKSTIYLFSWYLKCDRPLYISHPLGHIPHYLAPVQVLSSRIYVSIIMSSVFFFSHYHISLEISVLCFEKCLTLKKLVYLCDRS